MTIINIKSTSLRASLSLVFAATLWGVFWYPLRWLESQGVDGLWSALLIYSGTCVYFIPHFKQSFNEIKKRPLLMCLLAVFAGWTNIAFFLAVINGEVVRVLLLFYMSPIWATLLAYFILKERLSFHNFIALLVALCGMLIMLWQSEMDYPWPKSSSDWLALTSGMAFAVTNVVMRMAQNISTRSKAIVGWYGVLVVSSILIVLMQVPLGNVEQGTLLIAFGFGATMVIVMTLAVAFGVTHLPVQQSAVILLFEVVVGAVSAYVIIGETMMLREWIGGTLILATGLYVSFNETEKVA